MNSNLARTAIFQAIVRAADQTDNPDDLLTLTQAWLSMAVEEEDEPSVEQGEYLQTVSATMLGMDPNVYWGDEARIGFSRPTTVRSDGHRPTKSG